MKYLIACDLDGTLLNKKSQLSEKTIETLTTIKALGHEIVITTGRPYFGAINFYNQLKLDGLLITDNGGLISHPNDPSFKTIRTKMPLTIMHDMFRKTKSLIVSALYSIEDTSYAYRYSSALEQSFNGIVNAKVIEGDFDTFDVEPTSIVLAVDIANRITFENLMTKSFANFISFRYWGDHNGIGFYEVYVNFVSKASGLKIALDYYNLDQKHLIAIGDGVNDVEMIHFAHIGIAMKNAVLTVKDVAKMETEFDHDHDGAVLGLLKAIE